jgi:hypothetical protein
MAKSKKSTSSGKESSKDEQQSGLLAGISEYITNAISDADETAAAERVAKLRSARPEAGTAELVQSLIRQKCFQTGAVGAITSGASIVPGLGTMAALTFGVAADIGMTFKMQAELVLEIAATCDYELSPAEKQRVIMLITGISAGSSVLLEKAGQQIAEKVTERLAEKAVLKGLPVIGVAASAATNMLFTYIVGRRAEAYFNRGPEAIGDWMDDVRAISGIDERILIDWLAETTERSWGLVSGGVKNAAGAVIVAGRATGEVILVSAKRVSQFVGGVRRGTVKGISSATGKVVGTGKWAGSSIVTTASAATGSTLATGRWAIAGLAAGAGAAADGIAAGVNKAGDLAAGAGRGVARGAGTAGGAVVGAGRKAGRGVAAGADKARKAVTGVVKRGKTQDDDENGEDGQAEAEDQGETET